MTERFHIRDKKNKIKNRATTLMHLWESSLQKIRQILMQIYFDAKYNSKRLILSRGSIKKDHIMQIFQWQSHFNKCAFLREYI